MKRLADFRKQVIEGWTVQRIAAVLIVAGLLFLLGGYANKFCQESCAWLPYAPPLWINNFLGDFYANVSVDCLSVAFAILVIDRLNERRAERDLKAQLIREMGSTDNAIALRAVREMEGHGNEDVNWVTDGSLQKAELRWANLQSVKIFDANLLGAYLQGANLQDAFLQSANLQTVWMPDVDLHHAFLGDVNLQGARMANANL